MAIASSNSAKEIKTEAAIKPSTPKPILSTEYIEDPPLEDVYVGILREKRNTSVAIQSITAALPGFSHLKRCSGNKLLLAPVNFKTTESEETELTREKLKEILKEKRFDVSLLEDDFLIMKIPMKAVRTKDQAARMSKIWPVNFHPDIELEAVIDGSIFSEDQLRIMEKYMMVAVEAARLEAVGNDYCNGSAVIADPEDGRILAIAASKMDHHPMWHASMLAIDLVARLHGGGAWKLDESTSKLDLDTSSIESGPVTSDAGTHGRDSADSSISTESIQDPLDIDISEDQNFRKRMKYIKRRYEESAPLCYPKSLSAIRLPVQKALKDKSKPRGRGNNGIKDLNTEESANTAEKCGPYLCTGYWIFLLQEPCPMCAMGLLHSRISRVFYGVGNEKVGVLGTNAILHAVPGLNHRYQVWRGILEKDCEEVMRKLKRSSFS